MAQAAVKTSDPQADWQPERLPEPSPMFSWPLRFVPAVKALVGNGGILWPKNAVFMAIAVFSWFFLTPSLARTASISIDWIAQIYLRNVALVTLMAGGLHLRLYMRRAQGSKYKFNSRWLQTNNKVFLFGNQVWDNIFWNLTSACMIWTAYEAVTLWAYANGLLPMVDWQRHPIYCGLLMVGILFMRSTHFYWTHRLTHWKPLYRSAHYLHHKNVNVGPWSGLAMHPIEHLFYFSGIFLHWVIPSHPLHAVFHVIHTGISPAAGHTGFHRFVVRNEKTIKNGSYFHYLHHRYFECNYGDENVPLDKLFGSFHDGSPQSHTAMRARRRIGPVA